MGCSCERWSGKPKKFGILRNNVNIVFNLEWYYAIIRLLRRDLQEGSPSGYRSVRSVDGRTGCDQGIFPLP